MIAQLLRRAYIWLRVQNVERLEWKIDSMRVPYGGQPIAAARRQELRRRRMNDASA